MASDDRGDRIDAGDGVLDDSPDESGEGATIDWSQIRADSAHLASPADARPIRHSDVSDQGSNDSRADTREPLPPADRVSDVPYFTDDRCDLLRHGEGLDPSRERVPVAELHADRLMAARPDQHSDVRRIYEMDDRPENWIGEINPGFDDDVRLGRGGRTDNCADCARSFQETLEGRPGAAAEIHPYGLPIIEKGDRCRGEYIGYTEQWAGKRAMPMSYETIGQALQDRRGSAVVHAYGPGGGHAFNGYWDDRLGRARWADSQQGILGDWPPAEYAVRFPDARAILFTSGSRTFPDALLENQKPPPGRKP